jgi:hypothetical protein
VAGLPDPADGVFYIVSGMVFASPLLDGRGDVMAPGTGPDEGAVREGGQVQAVTRLIARIRCPACAEVAAARVEAGEAVEAVEAEAMRKSRL